MPEDTVQVTLPAHARDYLVTLLERINNEPEAAYILDPRTGESAEAHHYRVMLRATLASA